MNQNKDEEAEPLLLTGYEGLTNQVDKISEQAKVRPTEAIQRLVNLYTAWEKPDEDAKWQKILDENKPTAKQE